MRFGLGPKPGATARLTSAVRGPLNACLAELANPAAALIQDDSLRSYAECCRVASVRDEPAAAQILDQELAARFAKHLEPEVGFVERLVLFWANHFSMWQAQELHVRTTIGHFEREVIRKNVLGKFSDMLKAAIQHPAMVTYLDNAWSVGPNSRVAKANAKAGQLRTYNENLAREILELHTVGINGGYTQNDVIAFANILTGWTVRHRTSPQAGQFYFKDDAHEPGSFTFMGKTYGQTGINKGVAVLDFLAAHPSTAGHIAYKLLRHFVMESPPPRMVNQLRRVFINSQGNLLAVARSLILMREAWSAPFVRVRPPHVSLVSQMRAMQVQKATIVRMLNGIRSHLYNVNNLPWNWKAPDGFPERDGAWSDPSSIRLRPGFVGAFVFHLARKVEWTGTAPAQLATDLFPKINPEALSIIASFDSNDAFKAYHRFEGLALLFVTPEFMLR